MLFLASRSANVLVIFIVAIFAFCFASVFASMTGPIAVLPENNDSDVMLDNISLVPNNSVSNDNSKYQSYQKQTDDNTDDDSNDDSNDDDKSKVETTVDKTTKDKKTSDDSNTKDTSSDSKSESSGSDDVETTTDET